MMTEKYCLSVSHNVAELALFQALPMEEGELIFWVSVDNSINNHASIQHTTNHIAIHPIRCCVRHSEKLLHQSTMRFTANVANGLCHVATTAIYDVISIRSIHAAWLHHSQSQSQTVLLRKLHPAFAICATILACMVKVKVMFTLANNRYGHSRLTIIKPLFVKLYTMHVNRLSILHVFNLRDSGSDPESVTVLPWGAGPAYQQNS